MGRVLPRRGGDPGASYVAKLNAKGLDAILKKVGEEATEAVIAGKSGEKAELFMNFFNPEPSAARYTIQINGLRHDSGSGNFTRRGTFQIEVADRHPDSTARPLYR